MNKKSNSNSEIEATENGSQDEINRVNPKDTAKDNTRNTAKNTSKDTTKNTSKNTAEDTTEDTESKFYYALNHEIRRKMIQLVGENEECSFTIFKKTLKVGTGTIYHHLEVLQELLSQNSKRKYILTPLGMHAFRILQHNYDSIESDKLYGKKSLSTGIDYFMKILPLKIYDIYEKKTNIAIILDFALLFLCSVLIYFGNIDSIYLYFYSFPKSLTQPGGLVYYRILAVIKFLVTICLSALISIILSKFLYGKDENNKVFLLIYPLSLFPMMIFLGINLIMVQISSEFVGGGLFKLLMILCQVWTLWSLTYTLSVYKFIKIERSLIITLFIHYVWFNIMIFSVVLG